MLASFKVAWDTFEEMNKNGNSYAFSMDFKCTQCGKSQAQFPHIAGGRLIC